MPKDNLEELLPLCNERGEITGSATRGACHSGSRLMHPVVHLHVFNSDGDVYLQKRPLWKQIQPGKWDTAVGGHMDLGEDFETAIRREAKEELGLEGFDCRHLMSYVFDSKEERELVVVFTTTYEGPFRLSDEVVDGRFFSLEEIRKNTGKGILTPNFETEIQKVMEVLGKELP